MLRGREQEADRIVSEIEQMVAKGNMQLPKPEGDRLKLSVRDHTPWKEIFSSMLGENRKRSFLAIMLMVGQAFFFNSVFFTYGLVVKKFFHISDHGFQTSWTRSLFLRSL
jgi:hypothetical protein